MLKEVTATIVTIGDEILIGQIIDTNSQAIALYLNEIGVSVRTMLSISDEPEVIKKTIENDQSNILIFTGGLGPTKDDLTKHTLASYFGTPLIVHQPTFDKLKDYYESRGRLFNEINQTQADVPENCLVLENDFGTAPGMWFEDNAKVIISLPGVPLEMKKLMELKVIPQLKSHFSTPTIFHKTLHTISIAESDLAIKINDWEENLPNTVKLAYLPSLGMVRLRLSVKSINNIGANNLLNPYLSTLKELIGEYIFGEGKTTIEQTVGELLVNKKKTLATAESCTGGNIGHLLTSISGSSRYYNGGVISYSNEVKIGSLNVPKEVIANHGAVSEETVSCMAENVRVLLNSDFGLAVSGIAGPDGGTKGKPVGTVWIAFASKEKTVTKQLQLTPHRDKNIRLSSVYALELLRKELIS